MVRYSLPFHGVVLDEAEVVLPVACDDAIKVFALPHAPGAARYQLQVHARLRVRIDFREETGGVTQLVNFLHCLAFCSPLAKRNSKRFVTTKVLIQYFVQDLRFVHIP